MKVVNDENGSKTFISYLDMVVKIKIQIRLKPICSKGLELIAL
jgi:hypothetical protein